MGHMYMLCTPVNLVDNRPVFLVLLQALGVSSQDRPIIRKKIKDMKVTIEKVRRANEKMEKQKERLRKKEQDQQLQRVRHENASEDAAQSPNEP